jgi:hypothetical protein
MKSKPLEVYLVDNEEWRNEHPTFDVDPEIIQWATLHAEIWLKRWEEGTQESWPEDRKRDNYIGLIGQKCFELTLQQLEIPCVHNDPAIDWRGKKSYDFRIPNIGTIEVKTVDFKENQKRLLIKCREWHNSDYVFAIKLQDQLPTKAKFVGYATNEEVTETFTYAENEFPCWKAPCYWQLLEKLHPASQFFNVLKEATQKLWLDKG